MASTFVEFDVTLKLRVNMGVYGSPGGWVWAELIDAGPDVDVVGCIACNQISPPPDENWEGY